MATQNYQTLQEELDTLLARLQSGELSIDESVPAYERGLKIITELEAYLVSAQNKVTKLTAVTEE